MKVKEMKVKEMKEMKVKEITEMKEITEQRQGQGQGQGGGGEGGGEKPPFRTQLAPVIQTLFHDYSENSKLRPRTS